LSSDPNMFGDKFYSGWNKHDDIVACHNCVSADRQQSTLENQKNCVCYSLFVKPLRYAKALATVTRCSVSIVNPDPHMCGEGLVSSPYILY